MEITKENFLKLPEVAGVYTFWKKNTHRAIGPLGRRPIYIGKSVNLKSRLNSYLSLNLGVKTSKMVSEAEEVSFIEVNSDLESLLLESYLIKKHKPKYNIVLKDDKHALYIVITREEFPRILSVRKLDAIRYPLYANYGPFPNSTNVKTILKLIRKIFPYSDHKIGKKPCLYSHLGLCNPCPNYIKMLNAKKTASLRGQMLNLTKQYKQNIRNIKLVLSRKFNVVRKVLEKEMQKLSKLQKYEEAKVIRDKIKTLDYITQERIEAEKFLENPNLTQDIRQLETSGLASTLTAYGIKLKAPHRIECYDVSHLSGASPSASMVVAIDGEMDHSEYKHFKIRQKNSQSDYDSLKEVANRRLKYLDSWGMPDLIIVDGGLGQVKIFDSVFSSKGREIPIVGIAKNPDRLIFPDGRKVSLKVRNLQLVSRIRDEAHRFARRLHHKLLSKALLTQSS